MVSCSRPCVLLLAVGLLGVAVADAQSRPTDVGTVQLAGTAQLVRHREAGSTATTTVFEVAPRVGYFFMSGLAGSLNLRYTRVSGGGRATNGWGFGPGLTYYLGRLASSRIYPFFSGRTLFTWQHTPADGGFPALQTSSTSWLLSAGGLFLLADHVGLTGEFFYQRDRHTFDIDVTEATNTSESWGMQWGVAVFVN